MPDPALDERLKRVGRLYRRCGPLTRLFVGLRLRAMPFPDIESSLGEASRILELACGHGQLANYLALNGRPRVIHGVDLSPRRIAAARAAAASPGLSFSVGDLAGDIPKGYDAVVIIDSLHYLPKGSQQDVLKRCFDALPPGGRLVIRAADADGGWTFRWTAAHEWLATRLKITPTSGQGLHFTSRRELERMLATAGFSVAPPASPGANVFYANRLFVALKRGEP